VVAKISNSLDRRDMAPPVRFAYRLWLRLQGRLIGYWVGMAESLRAEIAVSMGISGDRIAIVEDPALSARDAARLAAARDAVDRSRAAGRLFLSAGRLAPQKRFDLLISAFARAGGSWDYLVILGEGPKRRRLEALARRLGVAGRVKLLGHCRDVGHWLARADLFVLASEYEGVPAVVVEAMAAGLPIVATDSSAAMGALLGHGRFGRLVNCGDEDGLAWAIAEAGIDPPDVEGARGQAARFQVERGGPAYLRVMRAAVSADPEALACEAKGRLAAPCGNRSGPPSTVMDSSYGSPRVSD
jgi:glycosyltransferase involved in cell wall biosynthesis